MAANLKGIVEVYQNLKRVWDSKPQNLDKAGELLSKLKVNLRCTFSSLGARLYNKAAVL